MRARVVVVLALLGVAYHLATGEAPATASSSTTAACPVPGAVVSSGYGPRAGGFHDGVDLVCSEAGKLINVSAGPVYFYVR